MSVEAKVRDHFGGLVKARSAAVLLRTELTAAGLRDPQSLFAKAADALKLTARDLQRLGLVDEIVPEPPGGAHTDYGAAADAAGAALRRHLGAVETVAIEQLLEERYLRSRKIGAG